MVEKIPSFLEAAKNSMNENELKKIGDSVLTTIQIVSVDCPANV